MKNKILVMILFLLPVSSIANEIEQQVQQLINDQTVTKLYCEEQITKNKENYFKDPNSEYLAWKLMTVYKECGETLDNQEFLNESNRLKGTQKRLLRESN